MKKQSNISMLSETAQSNAVATHISAPQLLPPSPLPYVFYWSRPIGASDSSIRLTVIAYEVQTVIPSSSSTTKPSKLAPQRINHMNVNIAGCCWATPITNLHSLLLEIQKTLQRQTIHTLEICFHNNQIQRSTRESVDRNEDTTINSVWKTIAQELTQHSGSDIQNVSFIYHQNGNNNNSDRSRNGMKNLSVNVDDHDAYFYPMNVTTTFIRTMTQRLRTVQLSFIGGTQRNFFYRHDTTHLPSSLSTMFYSHMWDALQDCTQLREMSIMNGPCFDDDTDDNAAVNKSDGPAPPSKFFTIILPRLIKLQLHNMYVRATIYQQYLIPSIEQYNIIPCFAYITQFNYEVNNNKNIIHAQSSSLPTGTAAMPNSSPQPKSNTSHVIRTRSVKADVDGIIRSVVTSCSNNTNTVDIAPTTSPPSVLSTSSSSTSHSMTTPSTGTSTGARHIVISSCDDEYIDWVQLLHSFRYRNVLSLRMTYQIRRFQQHRSPFTSDDAIDITADDGNDYNSYYVKLIDSVVMIVRNWYKD